MRAEPLSFRKKYYHHRLLALLGILLALLVVRARVLAQENQPIDWSNPHPVLVCPILAPGADPSAIVAAMAGGGADLDRWSQAAFRQVTGRETQPFVFTIASPVSATLLPPPLPDDDAGFFARWRGVRTFLTWFREFDARFPAPPEGGSIIYLLLFTGQAESALIGRESVATRRGRVGFVFSPDLAEAWGNTLALIAHETLHTVGALDHREDDGTIRHPDGYAEPLLEPRYPQRRAEVMALGIPLSATAEQRVSELAEVVLGPATAREIGWQFGSD